MNPIVYRNGDPATQPNSDSTTTCSVGSDLPVHPDSQATSPRARAGPQETLQPAPRRVGYLAGEPLAMGGVVTVPPLADLPGAVDVQLPMFPDGGETA